VIIGVAEQGIENHLPEKLRHVGLQVCRADFLTQNPSRQSASSPASCPEFPLIALCRFAGPLLNYLTGEMISSIRTSFANKSEAIGVRCP